MNRIARLGLVAALLVFVASAYAAEPTPEQKAMKAAMKKPRPDQTTPPPGEPTVTPGAPGDSLFRAWGQRPERNFVTVSGEVIDVFCYLDRGFTGEVHRWCALACIAGGMPLGLLDLDGNVWLLCMDHGYAMDRHIVTYEKPYRDLEKWAAQMAQVSGYLIERKGLKGIEVREAKLLEQYQVPEVAPEADSLEVAP